MATKHKLTGKSSITKPGDDAYSYEKGDLLTQDQYDGLLKRHQSYVEKVEVPDAAKESVRITATEAAAELAKEHDLDLKALVEAGEVQASGQAPEGAEKVLQSDVEEYLEAQKEGEE